MPHAMLDWMMPAWIKDPSITPKLYRLICLLTAFFLFSPDNCNKPIHLEDMLCKSIGCGEFVDFCRGGMVFATLSDHQGKFPPVPGCSYYSDLSHEDTPLSKKFFIRAGSGVCFVRQAIRTGSSSRRAAVDGSHAMGNGGFGGWRAILSLSGRANAGRTVRGGLGQKKMDLLEESGRLVELRARCRIVSNVDQRVLLQVPLLGISGNGVESVCRTSSGTCASGLSCCGLTQNPAAGGRSSGFWLCLLTFSLFIRHHSASCVCGRLRNSLARWLQDFPTRYLQAHPHCGQLWPR
ncbi:hypothetical protein F5884DRAFT_89049 [Xylogone sp. PMI_703]|nr:hypothetical protein F5884DRAFT_89049 [Xylogone sp. PMI_703]